MVTGKTVCQDCKFRVKVGNRQIGREVAGQSGTCPHPPRPQEPAEPDPAGFDGMSGAPRGPVPR